MVLILGDLVLGLLVMWAHAVAEQSVEVQHACGQEILCHWLTCWPHPAA